MRLLLINRVCEAFGCLPRQAARELDEDPEHLALDLLDVRQYLECKRAYDSSPDESDAPLLDPWRDSPLLDMVRRHTREIVMGRHGKGRPGGDQRR